MDKKYTQLKKLDKTRPDLYFVLGESVLEEEDLYKRRRHWTTYRHPLSNESLLETMTPTLDGDSKGETKDGE